MASTAPQTLEQTQTSIQSLDLLLTVDCLCFYSVTLLVVVRCEVVKASPFAWVGLLVWIRAYLRMLAGVCMGAYGVF